MGEQTMIEKVSRAFDPIQWAKIDQDFAAVQPAEAAARARADLLKRTYDALTVLREPTEAMIAAYDGPHGEAEYGLKMYHADFIRDVMNALIDAALAGPTPNHAAHPHA